MTETTTQTIYIDADPDRVLATIADIEAYPEWISDYRETEVFETDPAGYPKRVRLVLDTTGLKDTMIMSYVWAGDRRSVTWNLESSALLRAQVGSYRLAPSGSGTEVAYELSLDLKIPMIAMLKRKAERRIIEAALKDLKKRVEAE